MKDHKPRRDLLGGWILLVSACTLFSAGSLPAGEKLQAPDFSLKNLDGDVVQLSQLYGEGPIVINFWATWCKPCVRELPHLNQDYLDYRDQGLQGFAISEDSPWSVSKVKSFVSGNRYAFTVLLDTNGKVMRKYGLLGTPYTILLSSNGEIQYKHFSYRPGDEVSLRKEIAGLLEKGAVDPEGSGKGGEDAGE